MRKISRAATLAIATTALTAFLAPVAEASHESARLTVCVFGTNGRDTDVEVNRSGPGGRYTDEADPCETFTGLQRGLYLVDVDLPRGYRISDDDRWVRLSRGESERVYFFAQRRDRDRCDDDDNRFDVRHYDGCDHDGNDDDEDDDD